MSCTADATPMCMQSPINLHRHYIAIHFKSNPIPPTFSADVFIGGTGACGAPCFGPTGYITGWHYTLVIRIAAMYCGNLYLRPTGLLTLGTVMLEFVVVLASVVKMMQNIHLTS